MQEKFRVIAERIATLAGSPQAFSIAVVFVCIWAVSGPMFGFSDTWQLVINTGTTIVTFLMVFLIQNAQNRDAMAVQLKLDELLRSMKGARREMINIDQLSSEDLERLREQFKKLGGDNCAELVATVETEANVHVKSKQDASCQDDDDTCAEVEGSLEKHVAATLKTAGAEDDVDSRSLARSGSRG